MKNEKGQKGQVRTSIKIILLVIVVGLVCIGMRVPMQPVSVKSFVYEGETAVQVMSMVATTVYTNVGGTVRYVGTKTSAPIVAPENPYLGK